MASERFKLKVQVPLRDNNTVKVIDYVDSKENNHSFFFSFDIHLRLIVKYKFILQNG